MIDRTRLRKLPLAIAVYATFALVISPRTFMDMTLWYLNQAIVLPVLLLIGLPAVALFLRPHAPTAFALEVMRKGGLRLAVVVGLFCLGMAAFTTFKLAIPRFVPFYADQFLADADAWLHRGNPGDFVHRMVPEWAQFPLGSLYGPIWFLLWFGNVAFIALQPHPALRRRYFWSMSIAVCLLGTIAATAFSSVGPIFYGDFVDPARFAALMASIKASAIGDYMAKASGYLLVSYQTGNGGIGTGISAMPSMHLAIVTLNACMLSGVNRVIGVLAWVYVALILLGSVYLGWHYALDGYVSIVSVGLIWWTVGKVATRQVRRAQPSVVTAGALAIR